MGLILMGKINGKKRKFKEIDEKIADCLNPRKTKMVVEYNNRESDSIKSFTVKLIYVFD